MVNIIDRKIWLSTIETLWEKRSILWLSGVRRIGKTVLCRQLPHTGFFNCDLPSVRRELEDPEFFFRAQDSISRIVLDEVHRLSDPSITLKIAADEFPNIRILATGSSTLEATRKFRDSLTGRKISLRLSPVLWRESRAFGVGNLDVRLQRGGFPEMLLRDRPDPSFFEEWIDGFFARDIQDLFGIRNASGFKKLFLLLMVRSGGQFDATDVAKESGLSRPTVISYMNALEIAQAAVRVPPYSAGGHREIVKRPKIYGFDTGMIMHAKGWAEIRNSDRGYLWEHLVLDELLLHVPRTSLHYWRDKSGREVDFVIWRGPGTADTIESKVNPDAFDPGNLSAFRALYPQGLNYVVCPYVDKPYSIRSDGYVISVCGIGDLGALRPTERPAL